MSNWVGEKKKGKDTQERRVGKRRRKSVWMEKIRKECLDGKRRKEFVGGKKKKKRKEKAGPKCILPSFVTTSIAVPINVITEELKVNNVEENEKKEKKSA